MKWTQVTIKTTTEAVEAITSILYEAGVGGVAIEDSKDFLFQENNDENDWDYADEDAFKRSYDGALIKAYFSEEINIISQLEYIKEKVKLLPNYGLDIGEAIIEMEEVDENDWANSWKKYYKPTLVGERILIKPSWEDYEKKNSEIIIELDPGMAFGTGTHETTNMCIEELEKYTKKESTIFDIGCGSGILSIVGSKLGAKEVIGVDLDPAAVKVARENVLINKEEKTVKIEHGDLVDVLDHRADIVVANIIADVIIFLSSQVEKFMKDDAIFIASGIILDKIDDVKEALEKNGFEILNVRTKGEWSAIVSKKVN